MNVKKQTLKLVYSAALLALCLVLPFLTLQMQQLGNALCLMHIPVLLCGFICGPIWGLAIGFIAPLLRFAVFGMPPILPIGLAMAFELATYGLLSGIVYRKLSNKKSNIYISLIAAMLGGRVVWGVVRYVIAALQDDVFPFSAWITGAFVTALPGILIHILIIPVIVMGLLKAKVIE